MTFPLVIFLIVILVPLFASTWRVSLLGLDGIAIDAIRNRDDVMLDSLGAEFGSFVKSVRISSADLNVGSVEQFSLVTDRYITILSSVTAEYFVLLVLDDDGAHGRHSPAVINPVNRCCARLAWAAGCPHGMASVLHRCWRFVREAAGSVP